MKLFQYLLVSVRELFEFNSTIERFSEPSFKIIALSQETLGCSFVGLPKLVFCLILSSSFMEQQKTNYFTLIIKAITNKTQKNIDKKRERNNVVTSLLNIGTSELGFRKQSNPSVINPSLFINLRK